MTLASTVSVPYIWFTWNVWQRAYGTGYGISTMLETASGELTLSSLGQPIDQLQVDGGMTSCWGHTSLARPGLVYSLRLTKGKTDGLEATRHI